jgi:hypothetical protein
MDDLRVPKRRVAAEVLLAGGGSRRIALFLSEAAPGHSGPERPADLLTGGGEFVPAFDEEAQATTFLNRAGVAVLRVPRPEAETEEIAPVAEHAVEVHLGSGTVLSGVVSFVRPPERARLLDFLNEPAPFFRLTEPEGVALVNKRHVARIALART